MAPVAHRSSPGLTVRVLYLVEIVAGLTGVVLWSTVHTQEPLGVLLVKLAVGGAFFTTLLTRSRWARRPRG